MTADHFACKGLSKNLSRITLKRMSGALFVSLLFVTIPALAWGPDGHRIVASLAQAQLDDSSRAEVMRLLAASGDSSLADVSNWADDVREDPTQQELSRQTSRMHYVNFDDAGCQFEAESICANGQCVVAAIDHYANALGDRELSDAERAEALRFLVHFVADVHQPLHAGYRADKGGNTFQVQIDGEGSNLHRIWDSKIISSRHIDWPQYTDLLKQNSAVAAKGSAREWAEQSCSITRSDFYPANRTISASYLANQLDTVDQQLQRAAARLALLLNQSTR
ncbi:S1/P1 nuclease [Dokdonella sp.]|uniref:S1/P1 nuclease n=1 Tax=Dokdonella sp. TaxID=2291710 RepID=UPI003C4ECCCB